MPRGVRLPQATKGWSMGVARRANIKNQQLTTASTFHYVGAVALYIYPPDLPGGIFNTIANKCKLAPVLDTSCTHRIVYRLNSGRDSYIKNGGKLGRKPGSVKTTEQK